MPHKAGLSVGVPQTHLACDLGQSKTLFVEIQRDGDKVRLVRFEKESRDPKTQKVSDVLKQCYEKGRFNTDKVRISVKGQGVIVRFIQFPKMNREELQGAITFEAEKYIPFKFDEVISDFYILDDHVDTPNGPMMNLLLIAVKRDRIYPLVQDFQEAGLTIELIDLDALAFLNALEFFYPDAQQHCIGTLDIGTEVSSLSVVRGGKVRFIRDISYGAIDILKSLKRKLSLSDEEAYAMLRVDKAPREDAVEIIRDGIGQLVAELKVSLDYYNEQMQAAEPLSKMFLGGGGGHQPLVVKTIAEELGLPVEMIDLVSKIELGEGVDREEVIRNQMLFPVALGLCLRDL